MKNWPLIKELAHCNAEDFSEAATELFIVMFFSFMPLWLGTFIAPALSGWANVPNMWWQFLTSGDALLLASAIAGPLIYALFRRYGELPKSLTLRFPYGKYIAISLIAVCVIAAAIYGGNGASASSQVDSSGLSAPNSIMILYSVFLLTFSIILFFLTSSFRNRLSRAAPEIMRASDTEFLREWNE